MKHGEVYLKDYEDVHLAARSPGTYFAFHNRERLHESLGYRVAWEVHSRVKTLG